MAEHTSPRQEPSGVGSTLVQFSDELAALVDQVSRSIVSIGGRSHRPGTGAVIGPDLIITADHTLEKDEDIGVRTSDWRRLTATLVGRDPSTDLAVLRVENLDLPVLVAAAQPARAGALVVAVARAWQQHAVPSFGIVHGVGGPMRGARGARLDGVIHPGLSLTRGISGAPLVNVRGELLGLVTTGLLRGWPVAIPHETLTQVTAALQSQGHVRRAHLGVALQPVRLGGRQRGDLEQQGGALIVGLTPEGPADRAGLLVGDIIIRANTTIVADVDDVQGALVGIGVGQAFEIDIIRGAERAHVTVTAGEQPA